MSTSSYIYEVHGYLSVLPHHLTQNRALMALVILEGLGRGGEVSPGLILTIQQAITFQQRLNTYHPVLSENQHGVIYSGGW